MGIDEEFSPQLLPLSVKTGPGGAWISLLRSMCPFSGFPTALPPCRFHMRTGPLRPPEASNGRSPTPIPNGTGSPNTAIRPSSGVLVHHAAGPLHHRASNPPRRRTARHLLEVSAPIRAGQRAPARVAIAGIRPIMFGARTGGSVYAARRQADQFTSVNVCARRSFPDGVFGIIPGSSTTTLRGRMSTSANTSCAT